MAEAKRRITPSEVLLVINGGPPINIDPEASRRGIAAHKRIIGEVKAGNIPEVLRKAGVGERVIGEKTFRRQIGNGLELSARADLVGDEVVVDLKPGDIRGRHLLQAAMTVVAINKPDIKPAVYLYEKGRVVTLPPPDEETTKGIITMARGARRILDIQESLGASGRRQKGCVRQSLGDEAVKIRQGFDKITEEVVSRLTSSIRRIDLTKSGGHR